MSKGRDRIKGNMQPAVQAMLEPGEQVRASAQVMTGPSLWLFGALGMILFNRFYFLVVTDRRVLFLKTGGAFTPQPKGLAFSDPLSPSALVDYKPSPLWSTIKYRRPDGSVLRLRMNRVWIPDRDQVVAALRQAPPMPGVSAPPAPPTPPPPPA